MDDLKQKTERVLLEIAARLRQSILPPEVSVEIERLAAQVKDPCVVAIVGRVKAGKSTFINTFLGETDAARVGTTETTATITYFRYGTPDDAARPVRCHWRGGGYADKDKDFLNSLQGNDAETLRRSESIAYLEYFLPNPHLEQATLVDTPGTGAVVDEHQNVTAEFMQLSRQLRERHHEETERIGSSADAVIYLIGPVARATDQSFLEEFAQATGGRSRAINAIGVMAKIDLQPEVMARRQELAEKISLQLKDSLNTVVPVSAELRRTLDVLLENDHAGLKRLSEALRRIPPKRLLKMLDSDELFLDFDFDDCPLSRDERRQLLGDIKWSVFTTIARLSADEGNASTSEIAEQLKDISGFEPLKKLLEKHFFQRGHLLRCYRIVNEARKVLSKIQYTHFPQIRHSQREKQGQLDRFRRFIWETGGDVTVALELEEFLRAHLDMASQASSLENLLTEMDESLSDLFHELEEYNADYAALQQLEDHADKFTPAELDELQHLLGLNGMEIKERLSGRPINSDYVRERQLVWRQVEFDAPHGSIYRTLANCAYTRYGLILNKLNQNENAGYS